MKTNKRFLLAASVLLALIFTLSCSSDDKEGSGIDERLVTGSNEAWVRQCDFGSDGVQDCYVWIFKADGVYLGIDLNGDSDPWIVSESGKWSTSGNTITITGHCGKTNFTYTISGDTFSITTGTKTVTGTKRSGITYVDNGDRHSCSNNEGQEPSVITLEPIEQEPEPEPVITPELPFMPIDEEGYIVNFDNNDTLGVASFETRGGILPDGKTLTKINLPNNRIAYSYNLSLKDHKGHCNLTGLHSGNVSTEDGKKDTSFVDNYKVYYPKSSCDNPNRPTEPESPWLPLEQ